MRRHRRFVVAALSIAGLLALGAEFAPGVATAASPVSAAATTTAPSTSLPATTNTTSTTSTTTVTDCAIAAPTVTFTRISFAQLDFYYSSPSGYQCGVLRSTTLALYADAAHTALVQSVVLPAGTQAGAWSFGNLTPSTGYYLVLSVPGAAATTLPATTTTAHPATTSGSITSTSYICDYGGPAAITPATSTTTSLTYTYAYSGANACSTVGKSTVSVTFYTDAALTRSVTTWSNPTGATGGAFVLSGLAPNTTYYAKATTYGPLGTTTTVAPFSTRAQTMSTTTTTTSVACDPAPAQASLSSAATTSLTFSFASIGATACNGNGVTTVSVYSDAARTVLVGSAASAPGATSGLLTVTGLTPNTTYYPWVRLSNSFFGSPAMAPASTLPMTTGSTTTTTTTTTSPVTTGGQKTCTATWRTLSAWPGGFLGEVTVRNTSTVASASWRVGWTWSGSARLTASYQATLGGTAAGPTLTALDWNRIIPAGGSTSVQVQGTVSGTVTTPTIACALT